MIRPISPSRRTGCPLIRQTVPVFNCPIPQNTMQQAVKLLNFLFQILYPITSALANKLLLHWRATLEDYNQSSEGAAYHPALLHPSELQPGVIEKGKGGSMLCQRCRGMLVRETFSDLREETARLCSATRCINCGNIEDTVVRANQLRSHVTKRSSPRLMNRNGAVLFTKTRSEKCGAI
jgi:hypothetical protein